MIPLCCSITRLENGMLILHITADDIEKQRLTAIFDTCPEDSDTDLEWSSEEDEPPTVRGRKAKAGKEEEGAKGKGRKGKGKEKAN